mmetsp:Transcript_49851/g.108379  ORF Transcript_49851/g.108379 Transcript_49851/m.108379 type:complete len:239 (-) Transcript_49851:541-1257(-)
MTWEFSKEALMSSPFCCRSSMTDLRLVASLRAAAACSRSVFAEASLNSRLAAALATACLYGSAARLAITLPKLAGLSRAILRTYALASASVAAATRCSMPSSTSFFASSTTAGADASASRAAPSALAAASAAVVWFISAAATPFSRFPVTGSTMLRVCFTSKLFFPAARPMPTTRSPDAAPSAIAAPACARRRPATSLRMSKVTWSVTVLAVPSGPAPLAPIAPAASPRASCCRAPAR